MELSELAELIKTRRSVRRWEEKAVPEDLLLQAVELATWAPNGGNQQNWRFYLIENKGTLKAIGEVVQSSQEVMNSWPEAGRTAPPAGAPPRATQSTPASQVRGPNFFQNAPAAIVVAASQYRSGADILFEARAKVDPKAAEMQNNRKIADSRIQSVSSAIAYLLLVLHKMGLGAVWMTGPLQAKGEIEKILKVPPELDVIAYIPVGYPAETPVSRGRKAVKDVCEIIR